MEIHIGGTLLLFSLAMPLVLSGQEPAGQMSERAVVPLDGPKIFRSYCAACHGVDGKGRGPVASALKHAPPDLTSI